MYDPPAYVWALTIGGPTAIAAATCIALYGGAGRAGLGRRRAGLLAGAAAVVLGGWFTATAVIAGHGGYDTRPGQVPWLPIAAAGSLAILLVLSRIPVVARALSAPGMASRLVLPHAFRVAGVFFLLYLALGHLPALFALPAGLGDIAAGIAAPLIALRLSRGTARRLVVQRVRPHRSDHGHYPRRPHRVRAAPCHVLHRPDQSAPPRAGHRRRRAADDRPAHHLPGRARPCLTASAASTPAFSPRRSATSRPARRRPPGHRQPMTEPLKGTEPP